MKLLLCATVCLAFAACNDQNGNKAELKNDKDSVSYSIGLDVGTTFARQGIEIETGPFIQGMKDAADTSGNRLMTDEQIRATMMAYQQKMMVKAQQKAQELSVKAKAEGEKFCSENKIKPGVITTASGLQYKVIAMGKGKKPKATSEVTVHYRGTLINGMEFDNSFQRGEPITFPVSGVIPGWTEALQLMPVGSKWQLVVPSHLGYGDNPAGPIPPGSTLLFDLELIAIAK